MHFLQQSGIRVQRSPALDGFDGQTPSPTMTGKWPWNYAEANRAAYDALAEEYRGRRESDRTRDLELIRPFVRLLRYRFRNQPIHVLDLGCGNGLNLAMFVNEGFHVTGLDISEGMLEVARDSCPSAKLVHGNFLSHQLASGDFQGIFAKAIVHLFPKPDAIAFLGEVHRVLSEGGIFYVTTTVEEQVSDGLREKADYKGGVKRYRRTWTADELSSSVSQVGFQIIETSYNLENDRKKKWFNIWAMKKTS